MSNKESLNLFSREDIGNISVLVFCDRARDLLGANLDVIDQLWQFFREQERRPSKAIVLLLPPSALGPDSIDRVLSCYGLCSDEQIERSTPPHDVEYFRGMNAMRHFVKAVRNTEALVVAAFGGRMILPLFGPPLACDFRIVSDDFALVNRMADYRVFPVGGLLWLLARIVGDKQADALLMRTQDLDAEEAMKLGLVERIVPQNELRDAAVAFAQDVAARPYGNRVALKQAAHADADSLKVYLDCEELLFKKSLARLHSSSAKIEGS